MGWHILGAGSMGCLWASLLRSRNHPVTLLVKDRATADQFRQQGGITLEGDRAIEAVDCGCAVTTELGANALGNEPTSLIIATKAYDTLAALASIEPLLHRYRGVLLVQNGMGTVEDVEARFPGLPLYVGVTAHGAWRRSRFHIVHAGQGPTWVGAAVTRAPALGRDPMRDFLELPTVMHWDDAIHTRMWIKLAINSVINGMTVLLRCRNGGVLETAHRDRVRGLCAEGQALLAAILGPALQLDLHEEVITVATATASNFSSMLQDVQIGRKTEIDYINGYLCRSATERGIPVPEHERLLADLRAALA